MTKTDEKVAKYSKDIKEKFGVNADDTLLRAVTKACGPSIFNSDAETVSGSNTSEVETVKNNFLIKKLGLKDDSKTDEGLSSVMEEYGQSNRNKYRAVIYYMLTKHFKKESVFK